MKIIKLPKNFVVCDGTTENMNLMSIVYPIALVLGMMFLVHIVAYIYRFKNKNKGNINIKQIKFSHPYEKLIGMASTPRLIQALKISYYELSEWMINYDAKIFDSDELYPIPKTDLILLIFQSDKNMIFTTIRRYTLSKWKYYKHAVGELFETTIKEK